MGYLVTTIARPLHLLLLTSVRRWYSASLAGTTANQVCASHASTMRFSSAAVVRWSISTITTDLVLVGLPRNR